jgi:hypothetical protein
MALPLAHLDIGIKEILRKDILLTNYINSEKELQQYMLDITYFSDDVKDLLHILGLSPFWIELFYTPPRHENPIHIDGMQVKSFAKMNWIFGGSDSALRGYDLKPDKKPEMRSSQVNSPYLRFYKEDVTLTSEDKIGFPSIIDAGTIHQVVNYGPDPRWCVTMAFKNADGSKMTFDELTSIFKDFIIFKRNG